MLDLLLINSPSWRSVYGPLADLAAIEPPVWAGLIATYMLQRGFSVEILDAEAEGLTAEETAQRIAKAYPKVAAFCVYGHQPSASTQSMPAAMAVCRRMKELVPSVATVVVGTHPSALPERTLSDGPFDFVGEGEGPQTIQGLLTSGMPITHIPGLHFWGTRDVVSYRGPTPGNVVDLDGTLPRQAWQMLDMRKYRAHNWHLWTGDQSGGYASVQTSLGCPFKCSFCCINAPFTVGGTVPSLRKWSADNVARQLEELVEGYGITNVKIPDEMFVLDQRHVRNVCLAIIKRGLGDKLNMWAYARVDTVRDSELLDLMRRAGFKWLGIGVESGSKHVRDGVEKGRFGNEAILESIARVRGAGIMVGANYIFGLPDDTAQSMYETFGLAVQINAEWANFYCAMAYPGSALHKEARAKCWKLPEDPSGPGWIGYSQHSYETLPLPTQALTAAQVLDFRDRAHMAYFGRREYHEMLRHRIGPHAVLEVKRMLALGRPKRRILGDAP